MSRTSCSCRCTDAVKHWRPGQTLGCAEDVHCAKKERGCFMPFGFRR